MLKDLILKNRSYRRFDQNAPISKDTLVEWVNLARCSASGANKQPLKFHLSADAETNALIFPHLGWAGYLADWDGPEEGEQPTAYITILNDSQIAASAGVDHGIAAQSILLGAVEQGFGGCMIASVRDREELAGKLGIPEHLKIILVLAIGKPVEEVVLDPVKEGDIMYWRDENQVHHVPKRGLDEIIINR